MNDLWLITAGLGSRRWEVAARRLARQASSSGWFSRIACIDNRRARDEIPDFFSENRDFLARSPRGYGYWLWRLYLMRRAVRDLPQGTTLLFLDAGCELNINAQAAIRLKDYRDFALESGMCVMRTRHLLTTWCKGDTLNAFDIAQDSGLRTVEPGVLFVTSATKTVELLEDWLNWARREDYHHLDDSPSIRANAPSFIEHRHDQALLTALVSDRPEVGLEQETDFSASGWRGEGSKFPIWAVRNRHRVPIESGGLNAAVMRFARQSLRGGARD